jgi:pyridoxine 5-phosphate synthase
MTKLSVNVNKVATLRNTRHSGVPSVVRAARLCLEAGAHGITVHPRPDQRHIRPHDVRDLAELLRSYPDAEFNIEGNPFFTEYRGHAREVRPTQCTLVPDSPEAFTSDHGWDLKASGERLRPVIDELKGHGCRVSLFMDPVPEQIDLAARLGADRIELYTEPYAAAFETDEQEAVLRRYADAARHAAALGLGVNAGHDLNRDNLGPFLAFIPFAAEVSIGHALIADALEFGLRETVRRYLAVIAWARSGAERSGERLV